MNIIRTKVVELSVIPAVAYKQKLQAGGAGIKIMRLDSDKTAVATIDRRNGETVAYGKVDAKLFPIEAFEEAVELTVGLPYSSRGNVKLNISEQADEADEIAVTEDEDGSKSAPNMVQSDEYVAIVDRYSDEKGKLNYTLMNKDFIQFASKSKVAAEMVGNKSCESDLLTFIVKSRAAFIANKKESLSDSETAALIETLDEIETRSAFKELKKHINRMLAK